MTIWLDTETHSATPITYGTYKYAANCAVEIVALAIDDGPVAVYDTANEPQHRVIVRDMLLDLPDIVGREQILRVHARKITLAEDVNLNVIARL